MLGINVFSFKMFLNKAIAISEDFYHGGYAKIRGYADILGYSINWHFHSLYQNTDNDSSFDQTVGRLKSIIM